MTVTADTLLEGPRGRRMCLEWAKAVEPQLWSASFHVSYDLDPGKGTTVWLKSGGSAKRPTATVDDAVRALETMPLPLPTVSSVITALGESVTSARYWQEPGGADVLAAEPQLSTGLCRIADALAPIISEIGARAAEEQWAIRWRDSPVGLPDSSDSMEHQLRTWRDAERDEERSAGLERPRDPREPWSGQWWSTPPTDACVHATRAVDEVPLGLSLVEDGLGWDAATAYPVQLPPRVLELTSADDWIELCRSHPLDVTASRRHDWFRATGIDSGWIIPDWAAVADEWDAVHLTVGAYLAIAGRALEVEAGMRSVVAGWNPDATYWLTRPVTLGSPGQWECRDDVWRRL